LLIIELSNILEAGSLNMTKRINIIDADTIAFASAAVLVRENIINPSSFPLKYANLLEPAYQEPKFVIVAALTIRVEVQGV